MNMLLVCDDLGLVISNASSYIASTYACAVSNIAFALPTIVLNAVTIFAILQSKERKEPYQILILNLAFTDVLTGAFSMPSQFAEFLYIANLKYPCSFADITMIMRYFLGIVSFFTITAIAVERYVFVFKPYLHTARLTAVVLWTIAVLIWMFSIGLVLGFFFSGYNMTFYSINASLGLFSIALMLFCYTRLLLRVRSIRRQIEAEAERFGHHRMSDKDKNLLFIGGLIIISFFVCYTPFFARMFFEIFKATTHVHDYSLCWEWLFALLNSLVNPIISCTFNPLVKGKVIKILTCGYGCRH